MSDPKIGAPCRCIGEVFVLDGVSTCSKCGARWGVSKAVYGPQTTPSRRLRLGHFSVLAEIDRGKDRLDAFTDWRRDCLIDLSMMEPPLVDTVGPHVHLTFEGRCVIEKHRP